MCAAGRLASPVLGEPFDAPWLKTPASRASHHAVTSESRCADHVRAPVSHWPTILCEHPRYSASGCLCALHRARSASSPGFAGGRWLLPVPFGALVARTGGTGASPAAGLGAGGSVRGPARASLSTATAAAFRESLAPTSAPRRPASASRPLSRLSGNRIVQGTTLSSAWFDMVRVVITSMWCLSSSR
jgi:hypothetical protein